VGEITENAPDDLEGLDASAAHIASLLSAEPPDGMCFFINLLSSFGIDICQ